MAPDGRMEGWMDRHGQNFTSPPSVGDKLKLPVNKHCILLKSEDLIEISIKKSKSR